MDQRTVKNLKLVGASAFGLLLFTATLYGLFRVFDLSQSRRFVMSVNKKEKEHIFLNMGRDFKKYEPFLRAPGTVIRVKKRFEDELIYDQIYKSDDALFRVPVKQNPGAHSYVIFGGCSFTWGEGLRDEETLAWQFAERRPDFNAYNLGFPGGSVHTLIHHAHHFPLKDSVKEKNGYYIYSFMSHHLDRFFARYNYMEWVSKNNPHYKIENDKAVFKGPISEQPDYIRFKEISDVGLKNTLINTQDPQVWSDDELRKFSVAVKTLSNLYHQQFPNGKFIFMVHPKNGLNDELRGRIKSFVAKAGIEVWDSNNEYKEWLKTLSSHLETEIHKHDGHPSAKTNVFLSNWFAEKIKKAD